MGRLYQMRELRALDSCKPEELRNVPLSELRQGSQAKVTVTMLETVDQTPHNNGYEARYVNPVVVSEMRITSECSYSGN